MLSTSTLATTSSTTMATTSTTLPDILEGYSALTNNQWKTGLSAAMDGILDFYLIVPPGTTSVQVELRGGSGDADLFATYDKEPALSSGDACVSENYGNDEDCGTSLNSNIGSVLYVSIYAYDPFANVQLRVVAN